MTRRAATATLALVAAVLGLLAFPAVVRAQGTFSLTRLAGATRYETAAAIAKASVPSASSVVLVSGEQYADAVTAAYAAGLGNVPVLLTGSGALPAATTQAIRDLGATSVLIVGGSKAVGAGVENDLRARGLTTRRLAGTDRYATARLVAQSGGTGAVGSLSGAPTAVIASGRDYPDALAVGGIAYGAHLPTLLTPPDQLSPEARAALESLGVRRVLVAGGTGAVSGNVSLALTGMGITVTRLAGADRTATAAAVADFAIGSLGFDATHVELASGAGFADALAIGSHAGRGRTPLLLTRSAADLGTATRTWLVDHADTLASGHVAGGAAAVSDAVVADAIAAGRGQPAPVTAGGVVGGAASAEGATTSTTSASGGGQGDGGTTTTTAPAATTTSTVPPSTTTSTVPGSTTTTTAAPGSTTTTTAPSQPAGCPADRPSGTAEPFCFPAATDSVLGPRMVDPAQAYEDVVIVEYDRSVDCDTIQRADFQLAWSDGRTITPGWARCADGTDRAIVLKLAVGSFRAGEHGDVFLQGEVRSPGGHAEPIGDHITWHRA
ncbi:MAG: Aminopeptidase (Arg, Lys, Leu preference) [Actinomycetia bacterium]|nr:Aminopeptidase (Arg, Lys, Leu preference) [Actinomycetes bacterium]